MTQTRKKFFATLLAGTALVAASSAGAGPVDMHNGYFYVDCDDDDDRFEYKWERGRGYWKGKKAKKDKDRGKRERSTGEYRYEYRPMVIQPPPQASTPRSPARSFPRESATEHANAKARQREILERELAAEQQLLADSRARGDAENVRHHERNLEGLKRELRNLGS